MNNNKINKLKKRNNILTNMSSEIIEEIINNNTGRYLAEEVGIPIEKLSNALASPLDNSQIIIATKGHIKTKTIKK